LFLGGFRFLEITPSDADASGGSVPIFADEADKVGTLLVSRKRSYAQ